MSNYRAAINGTREICYDSVSLLPSLPPEERCSQIDTLSSAFETFVDTGDIETYRQFVSELNATAVTFNPWSILLGPDSSQVQALQDAGIVTRLRGGVESKSTARFDVEEPFILGLLYEVAQEVSSEYGNPFDEYVFVSDGLSASSGAILPYTSSQLWKNRYLTGATRKVSLVGYGGTGNAEDMAFSTIPASVQSVALEHMIVGDTTLQMLVDVLPEGLDSLDAFAKETKEYSASIAIPPYFATSLPAMPVVTFYDKSMGPGALPLQFIRMPLDGYIAKYFDATSFANGGDLSELYSLASDFFTETTESPTALSGFPSSFPSLTPMPSPANTPAPSRKPTRAKGKGKGT